VENPVTATTADAVDLVGRAAERELLRAFVDRARADGAALLLTGGPGVGKTALLDAACRWARADAGARVARAAGVQFEAEVTFAGLNQLFLPLHDQLDALPEVQREALAVALGTDTGSAAGGLVVSAAALALLRHAARQGPVLVVVDDAQWLDRASARVLGFVARRLGGGGVGILAAARSDAESVLRHAGMPEREVAPLDERASVDLLGATSPDLAPPVRRRVMAAAQGNPLALLELPATMTRGQRLGLDPLPPVLPLSGALQRLFADRVRELPAATRRLLLLAALDGTGDLRALHAASSGDSWLDGLGPAERSRLVRVHPTGNRVSLRHPLIGAAAVELATSGERRRAHAMLADLHVDDPERRAWHLAEAVAGPDEPTAALLEVAAHRALQKGDAVGAVHALLRAAGLSPTGTGRARRLAVAAYVGADAAGRLRSVPDLLDEARRADPDTAESLEVTVAAAHHLLNGEGDVDTAHLVLVRAIEDALDRGHAAGAVAEALHSLMMVCHFSGRDTPWRSYEAALRRLRDPPLLLSVATTSCGDAARTTAAVLDRLETVIATLASEVDPTRILRAGIATHYVDRIAGCRSALHRVVRSGREGGAAGSAVHALMILSYDAFLEGRWDDAARSAEEGIAWSERLGYRLASLPGLYCLALLAAGRGDAQAAAALTDEMVDWAAPRGVRMVEHLAAHARGLAALGRGDYEEAFRHGAAVTAPGHLAPHVPVAVCTALDLVEAAVRTGRRVEAEAHVAAVAQAEVFGLRPRLALMAAGAAALVASGDEAGDLYRRALAVPGAQEHPFEHARVRLAYGEHLRRARATSAARHQLVAAAETFQRLGARPWAQRARHELRASGPSGRARTRHRGTAALTPQEREIASLAASGLTNKQIAARLHLSPRTVSGHLYRIFPKLGVPTRAALRDALSGAPPPAGDRSPR
jgi:DNA-binding CsgD family transcriptional regulator